MEIRNDPSFAPVFLKDPDVLGVDAISGSQLVIPVVFRTLPLQQYGPIREFRRRVRLALEENDMLPGDPNRIFRQFEEESLSQNQLPEDTSGGSVNQPHDREKPAIDPTTIPAVTHNPLVGE
jgi:small conductance mechanosensitive channel